MSREAIAIGPIPVFINETAGTRQVIIGGDAFIDQTIAAPVTPSNFSYIKPPRPRIKRRKWFILNFPGRGERRNYKPPLPSGLSWKPPLRPRLKRRRWFVLDLHSRRGKRVFYLPPKPSNFSYTPPPRPNIHRGRWSVYPRKRLAYLVPNAKELASANQQIPPFSQTMLLHVVPDTLQFNQALPAWTQTATFVGNTHLKFNQQLPAWGQVATFAGEDVTVARLPDNVTKGMRGGPAFSTAKSASYTGIEQRVINFEQSINQYTLGYGLNTATWPLVLALYYAQVGGAAGFLIKDWSDYSATNQAIATGDGSTKTFQLIKTYATATRSYTRIITQPRNDANLVVKVAGTPTAVTLLANGVISFASAPANAAAITASFNFDMMVAFSDDHLDIQLKVLAAGQIPVINLKEIPPTTTGTQVLTVISAPTGNVDPTHLPENVEQAARGGPSFPTTRLVSTSGKPALNRNYPASVNTYVIGYTADDVTWPTILAQFYAQVGGGYGFTFRDWTDYSVSNQLIGIGDGATQDFQLVRLYDDGPRRIGRVITLPRSSTLAVTANGTPTSAYSLNANGVVHFFTPPAVNVVIRASFQFDIPVRFADDHLDVTILPGSAAASSVGMVAQIATINLIEILPGSP